jgi:phage shock protein A
MAQRGRPKKIEKQIEEAQERMRELWAEKREQASAEKSEAIASLTIEQQQAIGKSTEALREFMNEFSEMFDVSTETARKLQTAFWSMHNAFGDE